LLALQWADVSLSRGLLTVRAENAKSGKARQVSISLPLRSILAMIGTDPNGKEHKPAAYVFGDAIGGQIKTRKRPLECCAATGITGLHLHDLRHEAGSRMLEAGWPLQQVQEMLGHADPKTTGIYLKATTQHLLDSMRRFVTGSSPLHDVAREAD
jgi:integrase/recombinase XerC